jgi:hypothetical protein
MIFDTDLLNLKAREFEIDFFKWKRTTAFRNKNHVKFIPADTVIDYKLMNKNLDNFRITIMCDKEDEKVLFIDSELNLKVAWQIIVEYWDMRISTLNVGTIFVNKKIGETYNLFDVSSDDADIQKYIKNYPHCIYSKVNLYALNNFLQQIKTYL